MLPNDNFWGKLLITKTGLGVGVQSKKSNWRRKYTSESKDGRKKGITHVRATRKAKRIGRTRIPPIHKYANPCSMKSGGFGNDDRWHTSYGVENVWTNQRWRMTAGGR